MFKSTDFFSEHEAETKTRCKVRHSQLYSHTSTIKAFSYPTAKEVKLPKPEQEVC